MPANLLWPSHFYYVIATLGCRLPLQLLGGSVARGVMRPLTADMHTDEHGHTAAVHEVAGHVDDREEYHDRRHDHDDHQRHAERRRPVTHRQSVALWRTETTTVIYATQRKEYQNYKLTKGRLENDSAWAQMYAQTDAMD